MHYIQYSKFIHCAIQRNGNAIPLMEWVGALRLEVMEQAMHRHSLTVCLLPDSSLSAVEAVYILSPSVLSLPEAHTPCLSFSCHIHTLHIHYTTGAVMHLFPVLLPRFVTLACIFLVPRLHLTYLVVAFVSFDTELLRCWALAYIHDNLILWWRLILGSFCISLFIHHWYCLPVFSIDTTIRCKLSFDHYIRSHYIQCCPLRSWSDHSFSICPFWWERWLCVWHSDDYIVVILLCAIF